MYQGPEGFRAIAPAMDPVSCWVSATSILHFFFFFGGGGAGGALKTNRKRMRVSEEVCLCALPSSRGVL